MTTQYKHYSAINNVATNLYNVGIYARISREDDKNISESITNQIEFLERIVLENGWSLVDVYADDGISGTTFDRNDFNRLISDIEKGRIDLVITKDLSRLGRDYIQTGYYLEKYFPTMNVRYIAVNDGFDTFNENSNSDLMPFKSVFNDMYAKDISKKVRTALKTKQHNGSFLGTVAPYGYNKSPYEKGKLVIDPISSVYVHRIFREYLSGVSLKHLAGSLSKDGIPTPSGYRDIKNTQKLFAGVWSDKTVRWILKNEAYIGHTIQNKKRIISYKLQKQVDVPKSDWIKVENTHEPIISLQDFNLVQQILAKRSYQPKNGNIHLFTGFTYCGQCGAPVAHSNQHTKGKFYIVCSSIKRYKGLNLCDASYLREEHLKECVLSVLRNIAKKYIDTGILSEDITTDINDESFQNHQKAIKDIQKKIDDMQVISMNLYKDKIAGIITNDMFQELLAQANTEREACIRQQKAIEKQINAFAHPDDNKEQAKALLEQFLQFDDIDRVSLLRLVKKIVIYDDRTVDIHFTFRQPIHKEPI